MHFRDFSISVQNNHLYLVELKRNEGFSMLSMSFHKAFQTRPQNRGAGEHKPNLKPFDLRSVHGTFSFTADDVTFV